MSKFVSLDLRIEAIVADFHDLWLTPLVLIQVFYLLYQQLGPASLASLAYIAITGVLSNFMTIGWTKYGDLGMKQKDKRLKIIR